MPPVDLSTKTITRLQKHAVPLIDTFDTVISKLLDAYEGAPSSGAPSLTIDNQVQAYDPAAPPNLSYTTVRYIKFCEEVFKPAETYWNTLMHAAVRKVAKQGVTPKQLVDLVMANCLVGQKEDNGYRFLSDVGVSIQGQDANGAWRVIYHLASAYNLPLEVTFRWQDNPKATAPNMIGSFTLQ